MDTQEILAQVSEIPGLMTAEELALLIRMARGASNIVELGCFKGRSLAAMGLASPGAALTGVDAFGDMAHRGYKTGTEALVRKNLAKAGIEKANIIAKRTDEAALDWEEPIDLLHVDAGHSLEEVRADIANWVSKVRPGGAVIFHDYGKARAKKLDRPEVKQAVDEWATQNSEWVPVEQAGVSIAFRRLIAEEGALYVAYGAKALAGAKASIASLHKFSPGLPVAVVSDKSLEPIADFTIDHPDMSRGARDVKTRMYSLSPFRRTLYLDADTEVKQSPEGTFNLLKWFDVAMGQDVNKTLGRATWKALLPEEIEATRTEVGLLEVIYYNSGVIAFRRNEASRRFFQGWHQEWLRWQKQDQLALMRSLFRHPVRIATMRDPWNTHIKTKARFVYHMHRTVAREGAPG